MKDTFFANCKRFLIAFAEACAVDDHAKREQLTPETRLLLHQQLSQPVMEDLRVWLKEQIEQRLVEPEFCEANASDYLTRLATTRKRGQGRDCRMVASGLSRLERLACGEFLNFQACDSVYRSSLSTHWSTMSDRWLIY